MAYKDFKKGREKTGGRKKGIPNKFTTLKQAFLDAFQDKRIGGKEGLVIVFSKSDQKKIEFFKLISKMLPSNLDVGGQISISYKVSNKFLPKKDK